MACSKKMKVDASNDGVVITEKKWMVNIGSYLFSSIAQGASYVDKSLFIYKVFHEELSVNGKTQMVYEQMPRIMLTAPRCFGKSVNLDMLKCFLEIQYDEGMRKVITRIDERNNYRLFNGLNIMAPKYADFVENHFGKYPVLKLDFYINGLVKELDDAVYYVKKIIYESFAKHEYLTRSKSLSEDERKYCKKWSLINFEKMSHTETVSALQFLSEFLYKHFNSQIFVLIDDYDSLITKVMFSTSIDECEREKITTFYISVFTSLLKQNDYVSGTVITGNSYFAGVGLIGEIGAIKTHKFLDQKHFNGCYGFTSSEIMDMLKKLGLPKEHMTFAKEVRCGYETKNDLVLYNPWGVIKYIFKKECYVRSFPLDFASVKCLKEAFKYDQLRFYLDMLLHGNVIDIEEYLKVDKDTIEQLANMSTKSKTAPKVEVFLDFLVEQGYLSYKKIGVRLFLTIVNDDLKQDFAIKLTDFYIHMYEIDRYMVKSCTVSFKELVSSIGQNEQQFKTALQNFQNKLEALLTDKILSNLQKQGYATLQDILFFPLFRVAFRYHSEASVTTGGIILYKKNLAIIIELKRAKKVDDSKNCALKALYKLFYQMYYENLPNKRYFPNGVEECILIGLGVFAGTTKSVSICSLLKKKCDSPLTINDFENVIQI